MKSRLLHIASSVFLVGILLFTQVVVNFFHNNHDVHQNKSITVPLKAGEAGVQKHDEHCKVCAIDFFNHAFVASTQFFISHPFAPAQGNEFGYHIAGVFFSLSKGRGPPTLS